MTVEITKEPLVDVIAIKGWTIHRPDGDGVRTALAVCYEDATIIYDAWKGETKYREHVTIREAVLYYNEQFKRWTWNWK